MATDHTRLLRRAVVARLLATAAVTAFVGNRISGQRVVANQTRPFIRYGAPDTRPFDATCYSGSDSAIVLQVFDPGPDEDRVGQIADAVVDALNTDELPLEGVGLVSLDWRGTQILDQSAESTEFHAVIRFDVVTTE